MNPENDNFYINEDLNKEKKPTKLKKHKEPYSWTEDKTNYLIQLMRENPDSFAEEFTTSFNERFPQEKIMADNDSIRNHFKKIYRLHPELRREYRWTKEKIDFLENLLSENLGMSLLKIAEELDNKFNLGVKVDIGTLRAQCSKIYKKNPTLRRNNPIFVTGRTDMIIALLKENPNLTYNELAEHLNSQLKEEPSITRLAVRSLLKKIYQDHPELKKIKNRIQWTQEKIDYIKKLREGKPNLSIQQLTDEFNKQLPGPIYATKSGVKDALHKIYTDSPELKMKNTKEANKAQGTHLQMQTDNQSINNLNQPDLSKVDFNAQFEGFITEIKPFSEISVEESTEPNYEKELEKLSFGFSPTIAQKLRFLLSQNRDQWKNPEEAALYAEYISQLAPYVVHRARITHLIDFFRKNNLAFPKSIADFGAGPSTAYLAYQELEPFFQKHQIVKPKILDIDSSIGMQENGLNPEKIFADISKSLPIIDKQFEMVESTYVFTSLGSEKILGALKEANRITTPNGCLCLSCPAVFSKTFLQGLEQLGYKLFTSYGEKLCASQPFYESLKNSYGKNTADNIRQKLDRAYILIAQKIADVDQNNIPAADLFTFERYKPTKRITKKQIAEYKEEISEEQMKEINSEIDKLLLIIETKLEKIDSFDKSFFDFYKSKPTPFERLEFKDNLKNTLSIVKERFIKAIITMKNTKIEPEQARKIAIIRQKLKILENFSHLSGDERWELNAARKRKI